MHQCTFKAGSLTVNRLTKIAMCKCSYIYNTHWLRLVSTLKHKALCMYMYLWCLPILQKTRNNMGHVCTKKKRGGNLH